MISLLAFCCLIVLALAWIYFDSGTEDVFLVYGSQFRTACEMKAWSVFVACGWRLLAFLAMATACLWLTIRVTSQNPFGVPPFLLYAMAGAMIATVGFLFLWISLCRRQRVNRFVRSAAERLMQVAVKFAEESDVPAEYRPADYQTDGNWLAWHPKDAIWQAPETKATWFRIVPVVYATPSVPRTLVIPVDWKIFLIWGDATSSVRPGELLPFRGPHGVRFTAGRVRRLAHQGKWSVLRATMMDDM